MNISGSFQSHVFIQARRDVNAAEPGQQGLQEAKGLVEKFGNERKIVVFGNHAIDVDPELFSELEAKFGKAKPLEDGAVTFGQDGSNFLAGWYATTVIDHGFAAADADHDGTISGEEGNDVTNIINMGYFGDVFLTKPLPDQMHVSGRINEMVESNIWIDENKDGAITYAELKKSTGIDLDGAREMRLASNRGEKPEGGKMDVDEIRGKLLSVKRSIVEVRLQGADKDDPKLKQLLALEKRLIAQLEKAAGYRPVSETA